LPRKRKKIEKTEVFTSQILNKQVKMKKENLFFICALIAVAVLRSGVFLLNLFGIEKHLIIYGQIIHHFWFGVILIIAGFFISEKYKKFKLIILGIGLGIIADELIFIILGGGGYSNYLSIYSFIGVLACLILLFMFRKKIITFVNYSL